MVTLAPFAYYGGKAGLAHRIVDLMPPHRVYIEPFFGSGAVLFAKPPAVHEIINDLDRNVVTFFRVLREQPEELERVCALTPHARSEWEAADLYDWPARDHSRNVPGEDLERARRFWVRVNQSFAKTTGTATGWSVTTARRQAVPASALSRITRFARVADRLARCSIECSDGASVVDRLATSDTVVYADPPYLASTRNGRDKGANDYAVDMGTAAAHERLAESLTRTPATVLLSGYPSPLYESLYGDWWHVDFPVHVHSSNAVSVDRAQRIERVWCNRVPDEGRLVFGPVGQS